MLFVFIPLIERSANRLHQVVVHRFINALPTARKRVVNRIKIREDLHLKAGLFAHLAQGRLLLRLALFRGPLRERPDVAVALAAAAQPGGEDDRAVDVGRLECRGARETGRARYRAIRLASSAGGGTAGAQRRVGAP